MKDGGTCDLGVFYCRESVQQTGYAALWSKHRIYGCGVNKNVADSVIQAVHMMSYVEFRVRNLRLIIQNTSRYREDTLQLKSLF